MADPASLVRQRKQIDELPAAVAADFYISDDALVPDDGVSCAECGYDLRGRRVGDVCPECGTSVRDTLRDWIERLPLSDDPQWRRRVSVGLAALGGLSVAAALYVFAELAETTLPRLAELPHRVVTLLLPLAWFVAGWLTTVRGEPSTRLADRLRHAFRIAAVICLATDLVLWSPPTALLAARPAYAWFMVIRYSAEVVWVGTLFAYTLQLARRLPARVIAAQLPFVIVGAVLSLLFFRLLPWLTSALLYLHIPAPRALLQRSMVTELGYFASLGWGGAMLVLVATGIGRAPRKSFGRDLT